LITPDVLKIIHDIPRGRVEMPQDILECPDAAPKDLQNALLATKKKSKSVLEKNPTKKKASSINCYFGYQKEARKCFRKEPHKEKSFISC
jgi:hypothetical protein